jgi:hypothetical protein
MYIRRTINIEKKMYGMNNIKFIKTSDGTMKYLYDPKYEYMTCGNINTDYYKEKYRKNY